MKDYLKYASYIIVAVTIAYICVVVKACGSSEHYGDIVVIPADSAFLPIVKRGYRPNPLSFKKVSKPVAKLPKGMRESDVARTIVVVNHTKASTALIIETKSGKVFVPKTTDSLSVLVTEYLPAVVSLNLNAGVGVSLDLSARFSPSASLSFLKWYGFVDAPVIVADLRGLAVGVGIKLYHDIYTIPAIKWEYNSLTKSIILNVSYQL